ncbi:hypothetical protein HII31_05111 [Pseudocercospora fuligena]|uniref:Uncharacterized protein n=1 Tax=Pseudocercospora fuligena TaxID=685502 RepID=A0A8H6RNV9_9PEZI|nr:hypothetical protein HII31_05111 [Pseudocercospora fuligena]
MATGSTTHHTHLHRDSTAFSNINSTNSQLLHPSITMQFQNIIAAIAALAIGNTLAAPAAMPEAQPAAEAVQERDTAAVQYWGAGYYKGHYYPNGYYRRGLYYYPTGAYYQNNFWYVDDGVQLCYTAYQYYYC